MYSPVRESMFIVAACACVFLAPFARADPSPGGFVEKSYQSAPRTRVASTAFLPAGRGSFTFPAPYGTQGVRLTIPADCDGKDCVQPVGYSYWALMNNHVGGDTMHILLNLAGHGGPTLFSYDKVTGAVAKAGPLFTEGPLAAASTEQWYFSATHPTRIYAWLSMDSKLLRYDFAAKTLETVFDIASASAVFGANRYIWQVHSSADDSVHSFTVRNVSDYSELGCGVYKEAAGQFLFYAVERNYDECQVDKSGRWLQIKADIDGRDGNDNRIVDLESGAERQLLDRAGAPGHSDTGYGYVVGADNWSAHSGSLKVWDLSANPLKGVEVYRSASWSTGGPEHISHLNAKPGVPLAQQYACGSSAVNSSAARGNELVCFRLDGSYDTLVVAPIMTTWRGVGEDDPDDEDGDYAKSPKAIIDITGQYAIWTSNMGTKRMDAFIARIPSGLLAGGPIARPPSVSLTAPAIADTVACTVTLSADAYSDAGVASVQFMLDGNRLGGEATAAPYLVPWNSTLVADGLHTLTVDARDAAGNTFTSDPVTVRVDNGEDSTTPSTAENVVWTHVVNAMVSGTVLRKTAGCDGCADSGAVSWQTIPAGDGYVEFVASETDTSRAIGLSRTTTNTSTADIDFALLLYGDGSVEVRENGIYQGDTTYVTGDKFRVAVVNRRVRYSKNGVVFHRSGRMLAYPLLASTLLGSPNATIKEAVFTQTMTPPNFKCDPDE